MCVATPTLSPALCTNPLPRLPRRVLSTHPNQFAQLKHCTALYAMANAWSQRGMKDVRTTVPPPTLQTRCSSAWSGSSRCPGLSLEVPRAGLARRP
jgi:hypothetical protein